MTNLIITAYCACTICCGPSANNITAAGTYPQQGRTIAAPRNIPFGTKVKILNKIYTVEDRTAKKFDGRWDIYFKSHKAAKKFGIKKLPIQILK